MNVVKKFLVVGAVMLAFGGVGAVTLAGSAQARGDGEDWDRHGRHKWDQKHNEPWKVFHNLLKRADEFKQGGPLLHEHASLAVPLLKAQNESSADLTAVTAAMDLNSVMLAETVDKLYPGSKDQFLALWRQHVNYYTDYLNASKAGDAAGKAAAVAQLDTFATDAATLLDDISNRLSRTKTIEHLKMHSANTTAAIDAMLAGDWATVYTKAHADYEHMTTLSVELLLGAKLW